MHDSRPLSFSFEQLAYRLLPIAVFPAAQLRVEDGTPELQVVLGIVKNRKLGTKRGAK